MTTFDDVTEALTGHDPTAWRSLDDVLDAEEPDVDAPVLDELHADRWLRRLRLLDLEAQDVRDLAERERAPIDTWETVQLERIARRRDHYEAQLRAYHASRLDHDPHAKTIALPHGTLKSRSGLRDFTYDDDQFVAWATGHMPELVSVPEVAERPNKTEVRKAVTAKRLAVADDGAVIDTGTGEVVPGLTVVERGVSFTIDLGADE